ncbi:MAG: MoaD/ThiS family protein [Dehalococcoidia bacterium]|nr:MoaD/ThiS family protein [Dehalococcoidia bacterium]
MEVSFYATLRGIVGTRKVPFELPDGATVQTLLDAVGDRYPAIRELIWNTDGSLSDYIKVFVDGRESRHLQGLETPVLATSTIDIFPPAAGG